tara:strand:- start:734 stop:937 length:204 start_codon:yes stop_codon:yes gene_type:complete
VRRRRMHYAVCVKETVFRHQRKGAKAERQAIVAWLRERARDSHNQSTDWRYSSEQVADAIGGGAHHE